MLVILQVRRALSDYLVITLCTLFLPIVQARKGFVNFTILLLNRTELLGGDAKTELKQPFIDGAEVAYS